MRSRERRDNLVQGVYRRHFSTTLRDETNNFSRKKVLKARTFSGETRDFIKYRIRYVDHDRHRRVARAQAVDFLRTRLADLMDPVTLGGPTDEFLERTVYRTCESCT